MPSMIRDGVHSVPPPPTCAVSGGSVFFGGDCPKTIATKAKPLVSRVIMFVLLWLFNTESSLFSNIFRIFTVN